MNVPYEKKIFNNPPSFFDPWQISPPQKKTQHSNPTKSNKTTSHPPNIPKSPPVEGVNPQEFAGHQGDRMAHDVVHAVLGEAGLLDVCGSQDVAHADA